MISVLCRTLIQILFFITAVSSSESYYEFFNVSGSVVTSPNFPLEYNNNITYKYLVQAPPCCVIKLTFTHFDVENKKDIPYLCEDTLKIYDNVSANNSVLLRNLCGPYLPSPVFSSSNVIYMIFETDTTVKRSGFKAYITFLKTKHPEEYKIDAVRLIGGQSSGRVEFLVKDQWGPVCGENWSIKTGNLVCLDIGYDFAVQAASRKFWVKPHNLAPIFNLQCIENAEKLSSCVVDGDFAGGACSDWNLAEIVCGSNIVTTTYSPTERPKRVISIPSSELVVMSSVFVLLVILLCLVAIKWRMWCKRRRRSEELELFHQRPQRNPATMAQMLEFLIMNEQMRRVNGPALPARRPHAQMQQIRATVETPSTSDVFESNQHLNAGCSDTLTSLRSDDVFSRRSDDTISRRTAQGRGSCGGTSNFEPGPLKTRLEYLSIADDSDDADVCGRTDNGSSNLSRSIKRRSSVDTVYEKIC